MAGRAGGKTAHKKKKKKSPGLGRKKLEGTRRRWRPWLAGRGITPCRATWAVPSASCGPLKSQNSGESFGLAWLFECLNKDVCFLGCSLRKESSRANQDPPPSLGETQHAALDESAFLLDIQPTHDRDFGKMLAIRNRLLVDIKESVHRSPQ